MPTKIIENVFDRLDTWRHLPSYQLERRADIFFSLYLREVLQDNLLIAINENIIPEFPVRIGAIDSTKSDSNQSYKIDYVAVSEDKSIALLVELKTDQGSQRDGQDVYLNSSRIEGAHKLIDGVIALSKVTSAKQKYNHLIKHLEKSGLIKVTNDPTTNSARIENITPPNMRTEVVYILPNKEDKPDSLTITFNQFDAVVSRHDDPLSQRFSASLKEWCKIQAGTHV